MNQNNTILMLILNWCALSFRNCGCLPAVMHGPRAGVRPPNAQASWPWLGVGPAVLIATCLIYLPQLPKSVGLIDVFGQPAHPEVVNERPTLGHIGRSPHGYCAFTGLAKPWPILQSHARRTRRHSPCGSSGCNGHRVSYQANHSPAHTMYMDGCPMVVWPIQAGQLHARERSATD